MKNNGKKVVFASALQIFPPMSGGQLRSANLCKAFSKIGYDVEIYSFTGRKRDYLEFKSTFSTQLNDGIREIVDMNPIFGGLQFLFYRLNLPSLWITWILKFYRPRVLNRMIETADLVVLDFPFLFPLFHKVSGKKWLNTHNAEFDLWENKHLAKWVRSVEMESFKRAQFVLFCSERDRQRFSFDLPEIDGKSAIVANGLEVGEFEISIEGRSRKRASLRIPDDYKVFLFTGSSYCPNQEAFNYLSEFCQTHQKELLKYKMVVMVVGTVCERRIDLPHFKVLGKVEDIKPYFWASDFGLNPVIKGSGSNVKMMEFIAAKLPVLSTEFGCRGFDLEDKKSCFLFAREDLFATMIEAQVQSPDRRRELALKALEDNKERADIVRALETILK